MTPKRQGLTARRRAAPRAPRRARRTAIEVLPQPNDTTCGPTCLHAVYRYYGVDVPLSDLIDQVKPLPQGGTLAVLLACDALRRGFQAEIYTYNLHIFDPTWFRSGVDIAARLRAQDQGKDDHKLTLATEAYLEFLDLGGVLRYRELTSGLIRRFLNRQTPILTGLSATYLYACARERDNEFDDVLGQPVGHFVVMSGYESRQRKVLVSDPLHDNPRFGRPYYKVRMDRLLGAILLGIVTYDANLLVITPSQ